MAGGEQASNKLRRYLGELTPDARAMLMAELERGQLRGDGLPETGLLLEHLRELLTADEPAPDRIGNPSRLFFMPIEPFIVDDRPEIGHDGRIARGCVGPIWEWIANDLAPAETKAYVADVTRFMVGKDSAKAELAARALQDLVARRIVEAMAAIGRDDKARRQLVFRIGTPRAQADVLEFLGILKARDALAALASRIPPRIRSFSGDQLDAVTALLDGALARQKELFVYALVLVMGRLPAPWQLIRAAIKAAQTDAADRIAETPYAAAVKVVIAEIERLARALDDDFRRGEMDGAAAKLKDLHDALRGVRAEMSLPSNAPWSRQIANIRAAVANAFGPELETIPGRVRRVIRIVPGQPPASGAVLDAAEVADIEAMLAFLAACKSCAGELALNEITMRVISSLQTYLESGARTLIEVLRAAKEPERRYRQAQMDAAVRFCGKLFGDEYATLLGRAADVAAMSERKAAKA